MGDPSDLEKMGRELKCPICLSLLNSAVSLTCNHVFCNSCIMKSMKSGSNCPVCKVPYRRREVRAAPHMDNLVSIYKSMEIASGFNIFVTQNAPPCKLSDEQMQVEGGTNGGKQDIDRVCEDSVGNLPTFKQKGSRKTVKSRLEISSPTVAKPSFPTKKRVQVPQYSLPENSTQPEKLGIGSGENMKDGFKKSSVVLKQNPVCMEKGEPVLSPFFWLRDEDVEKSSQFTDGDQLLDVTPPNIPTFSDIKDSDDEHPSKSSPTGGVCGKSNVADLFDSEMFEWTQRACSPELFSSPVKMQVENTCENDGIQEIKAEASSLNANANEESNIENEIFINTEQGRGMLDGVLPSASSPKANSTKNQIGLNKSKKRGRNAREATLKKCAKENADKVPVYSNTESGKTMEREAFDNKGSSLNLDKTRMRNKKAGVGTSKTESKPKNVPSVRETLNQGDENRFAKLSTSLGKKQGGDEDLEVNKNGKVSRKVSPRCQTDCSLRMKKQKLDSTEINMTEEVYAIKNQVDGDASPQASFLCVPEVDDKNISDIRKKLHKQGKDVRSALSSKCNQELRCRKNKKVSFDGISEDRLVDDNQENHSNAKKTQSTEKVSNVFAKETESTGKVQGNLNSKILDNSEALEMNGVALRNCMGLSCNIQCAFCLSSEDSEASGEMVHYNNGKPVAADYNGGSKVIHSHKNCAEWAPNVYFEDDIAINLEAELTRSRRIKCCCCGLKGAALGCYEKSCRKSFHVCCAKLIPQCRWDTDNFVMLCPLHISSKLPYESSGSQERSRKKCIPKGQIPNQCNQAVIKRDISACQSWKSCIAPDKLVLCCSAVTIGERDIVSEFARLSGVTVLKNWDLRVTHVIASTDENGICKRTLKILMGILEGKWILSIEWVKACMKAMKLVEEEQYEINIDTHGIRDGPRLGRLRILNKQPKIFEEFKFYFMGDFLPSYKGYMQDLLIAGGGAILHRKPISQDEEALLLGSSAPSTFIIYSLELPDKCDPSKKNMILNHRRSGAEALASSTGAKAVSNLWVLNSIAGCKLQSFAEYW